MYYFISGVLKVFLPGLDRLVLSGAKLSAGPRLVSLPVHAEPVAGWLIVEDVAANL
jgi:hypothetical protein